jgi:hypothetical protein
MVKIIFAGLVLTLPIATWLLYKPVRILAPDLNDTYCVNSHICLEDTNRMSEASLLYDNALAFVNSEVGQISNKPRIIFCSTDSCNHSFGFHAPAKAHTIGLSGIVIGPHGWNQFILRHELIHHLQAERLGIIGQWRSPYWFKEGMAYSLSRDMRTTLSKPLLDYKVEFEAWYKKVGKQDLWSEAEKL